MDNYQQILNELYKKIAMFILELSKLLVELKDEFTNEKEMVFHEYHIKNDDAYVIFMINFLLDCKIKVRTFGKSPYKKFNMEVTNKVHDKIFLYAHSFYQNEVLVAKAQLINTFYNDVSGRFGVLENRKQ